MSPAQHSYRLRRLEASLEQTLAAGYAVTLVYVNVARFREVVRALGPDGADAVLNKLDARFAAAYGDGAEAHLAGDEFLLGLFRTRTTARAGPPLLHPRHRFALT